MFKITCFADEISSELSEQIEVMNICKIKYVELRSVWNKNVLDLSSVELNVVKSELHKHGIKVSSIGSPIGKVNIEDDFNEHMERFRKAISAALLLGSTYIRIFSFYRIKEEFVKYEDQVIDRLSQMVRVAQENGIILLHENEAGIYGESSKRCLRLFESINSKSFRAVFDPSNFVVAGEEAFNESFQNLKDKIEYMHIKDSIKGTGEIVVAGLGDGNISEVLNAMRYKTGMFLSLEPHLSQAGKFRGFTGQELFKKDFQALKEILIQLKIDFE